MVVAILIIVITQTLATNSLVEIKKDSFREATLSEAEKIAGVFDYSKEITESVAKTQRIIDFLKSDARDLASSPNIVYTLSAIDSIKSVRIIDKNGFIASSSDKKNIGEKPQDTAHTDMVEKSETNSDLIIHKNFKNKMVEYIVYSKVLDEKSNYLGYVELVISPEETLNNLDKTTLHDSGDIMVINKNGVVLYSTENDDVFKSLWSLSDHEKESISNEHGMEKSNIESMRYEELKLPVAEYSGPKSLEFLCKADNNEEEIASIARVGGYPMYLISEVEREEISSNIFRGADAISLISLIAIIIGSSIVTLLLYHFLKPLKVIKKIIESISNGNLDQDYCVKTQDEFKDITNSLQEITTQLKSNDCENCIHKSEDSSKGSPAKIIKKSRFSK